MRVERVILREIRLPLVHFFETSFGRTLHRQVLILEVHAGGITGWGESVAGEGPFYSAEDVYTAWEVLSRFILPSTLGQVFEHPTEFRNRFAPIRGHSMAKAALEAALWDILARSKNEPLWKTLGGVRNRVPCGVSIGIQDSPDELLRLIERELISGYHRIKIKVKPGWDMEILRLVRRHFPDIRLMVDANSAYTTHDLVHLKEFDAFDLQMIEQPLYYDDIILHSRLQAQIRTPICLDESIRHARDAETAVEIGACRVVNIKMGRVGGPSEAIRVHDVCRRLGVPVWCGGMLETGIGRAHNIALSTLDNFTLPGDVSASQRYFRRDTTVPPVEVTKDGYIEVPESPGIGYQPDREWIEENTTRKREFV